MMTKTSPITCPALKKNFTMPPTVATMTRPHDTHAGRFSLIFAFHSFKRSRRLPCSVVRLNVSAMMRPKVSSSSCPAFLACSNCPDRLAVAPTATSKNPAVCDRI